MGLDMYAYVTNSKPGNQVDFELEEESYELMFYWHKHPNLHGWMENLYRQKGGRNHDFNCVNLQLEAKDLDQLEVDIRENRLPPTRGFFFGESDGSEIDGDLRFIAKARNAIAEGKTVFYSSWW